MSRNIAGNFIVEKNVSVGEGFEFGYAFGFARPLATLASGARCRWCRENFVGGVEFYGGLGSTEDGFSVRNTASCGVATRVRWLLTHPMESARLGAAARVRVARDYAPEPIRRRYAALYEEVLAERAARHSGALIGWQSR